MSTNNRIVKNTLFLYLRMFLVMTISLYTSRLILKQLGVEDFGIYNVVAGLVGLFSFFNGSLSSAASRFITYELAGKNKGSLKQVFCMIFTIHLILSVIVLFFAETIGLWIVNSKMIIPFDKIVSANFIYQFAIFSCIIAIMQIPFNALIIAHERMKIYAYIGIGEVIGKLGIAFMLVYCENYRLIVYGISLFLFALVVFVTYYIYCKLRFDECKFELIYDKMRTRTILGYSAWSLWGAVAYAMKDQGVNLLLNIFFGPVVNAARAISSQISNAINGFVQNFMVAMSPQIIKAYACNDRNRTLLLLFSGAKFSYFLVLFFFIPAIFETKYLLLLWLGCIPEHTVLFTRLILINMLVDSFTYVIGMTVQATGNIKKYQFFVGSILLLNVPLSYLFLKLGSSPNVTFVIGILLSVLAFIVRVVLLNSLITFSLKCFFQKVLVVSVFVTFLSCVFPLLIFLVKQDGIGRFVLITLAGIINVSICIWFIGLTSVEKNFVKDILRKKHIRLCLKSQ